MFGYLFYFTANRAVQAYVFTNLQSKLTGVLRARDKSRAAKVFGHKPAEAIRNFFPESTH